MLIRTLGAGCSLVFVFVLAVAHSAIPQTPPPAPPPPAGGGSSSLTEDQQAAIAAARLGMTPSVLAAGGYSDIEVGQILAQLKSSHAFASFQSRASGAASHGEGQAIDAQRAEILAASLTDTPQRQARLSRCIRGAALGLPVDLAAACSTAAERRAISAALIAEKRAARLGQTLADRHATVLSSIRANAEAVAAAQAMSGNLVAIRTRFGIAAGQSHP